MITETVHTLYQYSHWANTRILDTVAHLLPRQLAEPRGTSLDSAQATRVHIMSAQWIWLARSKGRPNALMLDPHKFPDLAAIRTHWKDVERDTREFVATVSETDLALIVPYINTRGEEWAYPLWQQMTHQVNQATQHRSEVAVILTELGHSPGCLDLLYFIDQRAAQP